MVDEIANMWLEKEIELKQIRKGKGLKAGECMGNDCGK